MTFFILWNTNEELLGNTMTLNQYIFDYTLWKKHTLLKISE